MLRKHVYILTINLYISGAPALITRDICPEL